MMQKRYFDSLGRVEGSAAYDVNHVGIKDVQAPWPRVNVDPRKLFCYILG